MTKPYVKRFVSKFNNTKQKLEIEIEIQIQIEKKYIYTQITHSLP